MSTHDDRNINHPTSVQRRAEAENAGWGTGHYVLGGLAVLALIFGLMFMLGDKSSNVARTDRPAVTTTGSGAAPSTIPSNPSGTMPQRDINQPVTAPRPGN